MRTNGLARAVAVFVFRFRDYLAPALVIATVLSSRRGDFVTDPTLDAWLVALGLTCLGLGLAIRLLVAAQVDIRRSGVRKRVAASRLVVSGLYAHARNPLYLANALLVVGLALVFDSRRVYATVLPLVLLGFVAIVLLEEDFLGRKFGDDYRRYRIRVRRFVPRVRGLATTLRASPFDWRRALRREYGPSFATISAAVALLAAKYVLVDGLDASTDRLGRVASAWVLALGGYLTVRWLKKTARLETPVPAVDPSAPASAVCPSAELGGDVLR